MIAYFDTNVFDHLHRRTAGTSEQDLYRISRAVKLGHLRIVLSALNIEETLHLVPWNQGMAVSRVKLILELTDKKVFVKGQQLIMNEAIRAYATDTASPSPFIVFSPMDEYYIRNIVDPEPGSRYEKELHDILKRVNREKSSHHSFLTHAKNKVRGELSPQGLRTYPFKSFLKNNSGWFAEGLARRAKVFRKVTCRGVEGLLKMPAVAMAVGANLSLIYAHTFENRAPKPSDSRDILHALAGTTSDVFVTNDRALKAVLSRLPDIGKRIMSLHELVESFPPWLKVC